MPPSISWSPRRRSSRRISRNSGCIYVYKTLIDTPEARELGIGDISDARMANAIATIAESYGLANAPKAGQVFDRAFLPPKADRMPKNLVN